MFFIGFTYWIRNCSHLFSLFLFNLDFVYLLLFNIFSLLCIQFNFCIFVIYFSYSRFRQETFIVIIIIWRLTRMVLLLCLTVNSDAYVTCTFTIPFINYLRDWCLTYYIYFIWLRNFICLIVLNTIVFLL